MNTNIFAISLRLYTDS